MCINTQVHLAPLAPVLGPVLLAFPFAFAKELNAGAVHQQFQCGGTGSEGSCTCKVFWRRHTVL